MNAKTAKLLRKASSVVAFNRFRESEGQDLPDRDRIYKNMKAQWYGMTHRERGKSRRALQEMVNLAFAKPSGPETDAVVDANTGEAQ